MCSSEINRNSAFCRLQKNFKQMKYLKLLGLALIFSTLLSSCSKDDNINPILGEWQFQLVLANGSSVPQLSCTLENKLIFEDNQNCRFLIFEENMTNGECFISSDELYRWTELESRKSYKLSASTFLSPPLAVLNGESFNELFFELDGNELPSTIAAGGDTYELVYRKL